MTRLEKTRQRVKLHRINKTEVAKKLNEYARLWASDRYKNNEAYREKKKEYQKLYMRKKRSFKKRNEKKPKK